MKIGDLFLTESCLSRIKEDFFSAFNALKKLWQDERTLTNLNEAEKYFQYSLSKKGCEGTCQRCFGIIYSLFRKIEKVGLEKVFYEHVLLRRRIKQESI